ncbi:MAG TPA: hypothetical protein VFL80_00235 [Thermoanaerobaculia bacterium]|nr:hypothetical protein [Thermoanaerobaculia bacterium]
MRLAMRLALLCLFVPLVASAQYKDLDVALQNLSRGFGSGDAQAIVAGIGDGDKVLLEFPGLVEESGFFGRDQAAYLLDGLFNKVNPTGFDQESAKGQSSQKQYHISGTWMVEVGKKAERRDLYITLQNKNDRWSLASVRAASK